MTWTSETVKQRLREAADCDRRCFVSGCWPAGYRTSWPLEATSWSRADLWSYELRQAELDPKERDRPTYKPAAPSGAEIDRMNEVFENWIPMIATESARRATLAWAYRIKWRLIAEKIATSSSRARRLVDHSVATIASELAKKG